MSRDISIANQKGGVGKTSTAVHLGMGLVREGKKVLVIDLDAQANLTISLGYQNPDNLGTTVADIMTKIIDEKPLVPGEGILHYTEGVDLLPSNNQLSGMDTLLVNTMSRENVLKIYVNTVKPKYDYILIDCMPSLSIHGIPSSWIAPASVPTRSCRQRLQKQMPYSFPSPRTSREFAGGCRLNRSLNG